MMLDLLVAEPIDDGFHPRNENVAELSQLQAGIALVLRQIIHNLTSAGKNPADP